MNDYVKWNYSPTNGVKKETFGLAWDKMVKEYSTEQVTTIRDIIGPARYLFLVGDVVIIANSGHPTDLSGRAIDLISRNKKSLETLAKNLGLPKKK